MKIITVGRISKVKNLDILIEIAKILKDIEIRIAGKPITKKDEIYLRKLKFAIKEKGLENRVIFVGSIPYKDIEKFYHSGDLFVNFSDTGSIDKAVLEAMACGLPILTSNEAFNFLPSKYITSKDPKEIVEKIMALAKEHYGKAKN